MRVRRIWAAVLLLAPMQALAAPASTRRAAPAPAAAPVLSPQEVLCASNPAFSASIMRVIVEEQLQKDHDPSLDGSPPEKLAEEAAAQGITECATELRRDGGTYAALSSLPPGDRVVGWDAYNTACAEHTASKGDCIRSEVGAQQALKRMAASNKPPGAKTLVQTCQLVMQTDPAMTEWRECVDLALAMHAPEKEVARCKLSVGWHTAKTGADAGRVLAQCLKG